MIKRRALLTLALCTVAISSCKKEAEADPVVSPSAAPPSMVDPAVLPEGNPPEPLRPIDATVAPVDGERANALSPAQIEATGIAALPATLMFNDKPIDPLCFTQTWEQPADSTIIDLTACETPNAVRTPDQGKYKPEPGAYGVAYRPGDATVETMPVASIIEYRYLGDVGTDHAVMLTESGGGSGTFTSLYLLHRDGDRLKVTRTLASGDRCNNGVTGAAVANGALSYGVNLTPAALYTLAGGNNAEELSGGPLKDCAVCCYAVAHYNNDGLANVTFNPDLAGALAPEDEGSYGCFDGLVQKHLNAALSPAQLKDFGTELYAACLAPENNAAP